MEDDVGFEEAQQALKQVGLRDAVVKVYGDASLEDLIGTILRQTVYRKSVVVVGRADLANREEVEGLRRRAADLGIGAVAISAYRTDSLRLFVEKVYGQLYLITPRRMVW
jgi:ribosome-interacting GTPase 1